MQFFNVEEARVWAFERVQMHSWPVGYTTDDMQVEAEKLAQWVVNGPPRAPDAE